MKYLLCVCVTYDNSRKLVKMFTQKFRMTETPKVQHNH